MASEANDRLCRAAMDDDVPSIAAALLAGADPNALDGGFGMTPLQWAVSYGHLAAITALLAAGARADSPDRMSDTPLDLAASRGHTAAVNALLAAGADLHRADNGGYTALHRASRNGHMYAARVLLDAGARMDVRNVEGKRPIDVVSVLLAHCCCALMPPAPLPRRCAQVCSGWGVNKSIAPALRALFASAAPWSRRRPVTLACYAVEWEWEA
jgi:hypothetical protein